MGYYSEVALALTKTGVQTLNEKLADPALPEKIREEVVSLLGYADKHSRDEESGAEVWYWEDIKWYEFDTEYFPEVDFMVNLMSELDEEEYRFIRVGEDNDDSEVSGCFCEDPFDLTFCRHISLAVA